MPPITPTSNKPSTTSLPNSFAQAISAVERHNFVQHSPGFSFSSHGFPSKNLIQQSLSALKINSQSRVLHIGTGTGYLTAVLAKICREVYTVEKLNSLAKHAHQHFQKLGLPNIFVHNDDGLKGWPEHAPFDAIIISTPLKSIPNNLLKQLADYGELLTLEPLEDPCYLLVKYQKNSNEQLLRKEISVVDFSKSKGDILIELGIVDDNTLQQARQQARRHKTPVIDELRKLVQIEDKELYHSLATEYNLPLGNVERLLKRSTPYLFANISKAFLDHHRIVPLYIEDKTLTVATSNPEVSLDALKSMFPDTSFKKVLVTPTDFRRLWSAMDLCQHPARPQMLELSTDSDDNEDLLKQNYSNLETHLVALFEALLLDAVAERASDIHLEIYQNKVRIRLRIDGALQDLQHYQLNLEELRGLINIIKLRAELNIAERRLPQGGRSRLKVGQAIFDLRVQIQPCLHGEHAIIRLLPQSQTLISIEQLGLPARVAHRYKRLLNNPAGLILVVGPTGSGKSTTLYAGLQTLAQDQARKVITIEDPIEYSISNIQQTQVKPDIGFHFADAMRAFVRQDPDVIMLGEIRDQETALEAIRASQTGHVVISTLHCNDAVDALQRIYDLGIHPNSIASELLAVLAQRLAKRICPHCKTEDTADPAILAELFPLGTPASFRCYKGTGCEHCNGSGTHGRIGVVEYMEVNLDIRNAISSQPPIGKLRKLALDAGLITMRDSALDHVIQGVIPLSELPRILPQERMAPEARWEQEHNL